MRNSYRIVVGKFKHNKLLGRCGKILLKYDMKNQTGFIGNETVSYLRIFRLFRLHTQTSVLKGCFQMLYTQSL